MATISQRITLEGGDEVKKQLEALGKAGEKSFKQLQDAAQKSKVDPAQYAAIQKNLDGLIGTGTKLANQFLELARAATGFGTQGAQASSKVTDELNKTSAAAQRTQAAMQQTGQQIASVGQGAGSTLISTANAFRLAAIGMAAGIGALTQSLSKGAVDTATKLTDTAEALGLTTDEYLELRKAADAAGVSQEQFAKSISKAAKIAKEMKEPFRGGEFFEFDFKLPSGAIVTLTKMRGEITAISSRSSEARAEMKKLGIDIDQIPGGIVPRLRAMAQGIASMTNLEKQAAEGQKLFGDNWKETVKVLTTSKNAIDEAGKSSRDMTAQQIADAVKLKEAWDEQAKAIQSLKDLIGAQFFGGALTRAEWITKLVDGSRELLKVWLGLSKQKAETFLKGLGDSPAEIAFTTMIRLGNQLAGIWKNVLVPAGKALSTIVGQIAGNFEGVTKSEVATFFITAAGAVVLFGIALKGVALVLAPFRILIGLFTSFAPILIPLAALVAVFWDEIKSGAQSAAALIPNSLDLIKQSFAALFRGDFAGFWRLFSEGATAAFSTINQSIVQSEGVVADFYRALTGQGVVVDAGLKQFGDAVRSIGKELPGLVDLIPGLLKALGTAFVILKNIVDGVAASINAVFGGNLTGTDVGALIIVGSLIGAFGLLGKAIGAVTIAWRLFNVVFATSATGAVVILLITAVTLLITHFEEVKRVAADMWAAIKRDVSEVKALIDEWVVTPVGNAWQWIVDTFNAAIGFLGTAIDGAKALITDWVTTPVGNAWQWIVDKWNAMLAALGFGGGGKTGGKDATFGVGAHAAGGLLGGRGTGTSDSNLAWVSRGEHIMPARAVQQPGVLAFLEALRRSGGSLRDVLDGMGRFALGGMVGRPISIPAMAGGSMSNVTIQFPGLPEITGLRASSGVVDELRKAAALAQVRSGGRKPSRYS